MLTPLNLLVIAAITYLVQELGQKIRGGDGSVSVRILWNLLLNAGAIMAATGPAIFQPGAWRNLIAPWMLASAAAAGIHGTVRSIALQQRENRRSGRKRDRGFAA